MGILEIVILVGSAAAAVGSTWQFLLRPLGRLVTAIHDGITTVNDLGVRVETIEGQTRQLTNNHGSHLKDMVERIEMKLDFHIDNSREVERDIRKQILDLASYRPVRETR